MTRTVWNHGEKDLMLQYMTEIAAKRPSIPSKDLMREAQQRLPSHRRVIINDQRVFTYKKMIQEAREAGAKLKVPKPPIFEVKPEPPPEPPAPKEPTIGELFELLVDKISDRVLQKIEARQQAAETPMEIEIIRPETVAPHGWLDELKDLAIRKKRKTSCLIVGLNGAQVENIRQHQPNIDFTFLTAEHALSHITFSKDHTILMTKFINHGVHSKYKRHHNMHYCNGGVTELKYLLNGLFGRPA